MEVDPDTEWVDEEDDESSLNAQNAPEENAAPPTKSSKSKRLTPDYCSLNLY